MSDKKVINALTKGLALGTQLKPVKVISFALPASRAGYRNCVLGIYSTDQDF